MFFLMMSVRIFLMMSVLAQYAIEVLRQKVEALRNKYGADLSAHAHANEEVAELAESLERMQGD